ncbi:MAG: FHA domain-containing protein, partial [Pseudomonadota bacterium]
MNQDFEARTVMGLPAGETLRVRLPGAEPYTVPLIKAQTVVGRAAESDLVLDHPSVSRRHALIERQGEALAIRDLGSSNGLTLDGRRVESLELTPGRVVCLGQVELVLECAAPLETPAAAPGQAPVVQAGAAAPARGPAAAAKAGKSRR